MSASDRTLAQRAAIVMGTSFALLGIAGLIVNPDFGTGAGTSATQFLVDWNGWHAVDTLLLATIAFAAASRPAWATTFHGYNAVLNSAVSVWALVDTTPLGLLDFPNVATDVVLHLLFAGASAAVLVVQLRRDRAAEPRPAAG